MTAKTKKRRVKKTSRKGKGTVKRFLYAFVLLILSIFGAVYGMIWFYGNDLLKNYIEATVKSDSKGLYKAEMKDLHIDLLTGYVRISGFRLTPDTVLYIKMSKTDSMAPFLVSARINRFRVSGIDFLKAFWDKDIRIRLIMVQAPELEVHLYPPPHELKNSSPGKILLSIPLPKGIRSILLDKLVIRDANLSVVFHSGGKRTCIKVPHAGITATTVQIDEKHKSRTKIFNAEDIQVVLKDLVLETPDHMNALQFGTIRVSTGSSVAGIENLHLLPSFSRYEYSRKKGHQADRTDIQVRTIEMHQVELRKLIVEHKVIIGTIMVDGLIVDDFLDRRVAEISGYFPPMPQQALLKSGQYLKIDRIIVKHGKVTYTEQAGTEPGVLFFTDMEANLTNLTNDPQLVRKRTIMEFNGTGLLMGKGRFSGTFRFPLGAPGDPFTFSGELSHMEMKEINPMMTKLVPLEIRSGDVDRLIIPPIQANDDEASGKMEFCYHGLNIRLLNQGTDAWSRIKTTVMNTAATMIIKKENPSTGGTLREGIINFRRNKSASFFNFVWKSALTGLKSTIGINTREQKKLKKEGKKN